MKQLFNFLLLFVLLAAGLQIMSCKKDKKPEVISGFSFKVDAVDFKKVTFTNAAQNFTSLSWDFGDGTAVSSDANPVHTYAAVGTFTVKLTATGSDGTTDVSTQSVAISDPNATLTMLVGNTSKTWKLLRVTNANRWPLEVGPIDKSQVWWAMGKGNDEIANRPCMLNDEFTFYRDGSYKINLNGDIWGEGGVFNASVANACVTTGSANMIGVNNEDLSAWGGGGNYTFALTNGTKPTLTVTGLGAYVGFFKAGTDVEVKVPQPAVTYQLIKLTDADVDTLVVEADYKFTPTDLTPGGYWKFTLVHYDDATKEPPIPAKSPVSGFTTTSNGLTVSFTNTSQYGVTYNWDFGDGSTATTKDASHTYATGGAYKVVLTASNNAGSSTSNAEIFVNTTSITDADLQGASWKVRVDDNSVFVGPAIGSNAWYHVTKAFLDGSSSGADDWSCMNNDEFIFKAGGVYQYKTNGDARNDGYMGSPNGCISDLQLDASGNGAAFGSSAHTYVLTPGTSTTRPIITLTNGAFGAAFIGFYKGYYGGENSDATKPPNGGNTTNRYEVVGYAKGGGKEFLFLSVDISAAHDGSAAWSVVLTR
jgi:PKD repeat protein